MSPRIDELVIRSAAERDADTLRRLAALDSARPLRGDVLLAEAGGRPVAAIAVADGRVVADPFTHTAAVIELLALRVAHLAAPAPRPARRWALRRRSALA